MKVNRDQDLTCEYNGNEYNEPLQRICEKVQRIVLSHKALEDSEIEKDKSIAQLKQESRALKKRIEKLESDLDLAQGEIIEKFENCKIAEKELKQAIEQEKLQKVDCETHLGIFTEKNTELTTQLEILSGTNLALEKSKEALKKSEKDLKKSKEALQVKEDALDDLTRMLGDEVEKVTALNLALEKSKEALKKSEEDLKKSKEALQVKEDALDDEVEKVTALNANWRQLEEGVEEYKKNELQRTDEVREKITQELTVQLQDERKNFRKEKEKIRNDMQSQVDEQRKLLTTALEKGQQKQAQINTLKAKNSLLKGQLIAFGQNLEDNLIE